MEKQTSDYKKTKEDFILLSSKYKTLLNAGKSEDSIKMKHLKSKIDSINSKLKEIDKYLCVYTRKSKYELPWIGGHK